jgi:hypothetical protein
MRSCQGLIYGVAAASGPSDEAPEGPPSSRRRVAVQLPSCQAGPSQEPRFKLANHWLGLRVLSSGSAGGVMSFAAAWNTALSRLAASTVKESGGLMIIRVSAIGCCSTSIATLVVAMVSHRQKTEIR